jgi:hypothetical protein
MSSNSPLKNASSLMIGVALACFFAFFAVLGVVSGPRVEAAPESVPPATLVSGGFGPALPKGKSAVYGAQEIPLRFDHGQHLAVGVDCQVCHADAATSTRSADRLLPAPQTCDACHQSNHPVPALADEGELACSTCHAASEQRRVTASVRMPNARIHFNHALHMSKEVGANCETCHGDMSKVRLATVLQLPDEATCLSCHDGDKASDRCSTCHLSDASGRLSTRPLDSDFAGHARLMPQGDSNWRGAAHDLNFVQDHAGVAKANPSLCRACHDDDSCLDCHAGSMRPLRIHAADFLSTHGMDARSGRSDCQSCHRAQTDCLACHQRVGLSSDRGSDESAFGPGAAVAFHPAGWSDGIGGRQGHAFAAQRNIRACVSCHEEDSCLACHSGTQAARPGLGVSPHGPDFASSLRCQTLANRNRRACLQCHAPGEAQLDCR